jgi:hypothetical protein
MRKETKRRNEKGEEKQGMRKTKGQRIGRDWREEEKDSARREGKRKERKSMK